VSPYSAALDVGRVDVDHEPARSRPGAGRPRAPQRLAEHAVELAHVSEAEAAQERPERRGRAPVRPARSTSQSSIESAPSAIA